MAYGAKCFIFWPSVPHLMTCLKNNQPLKEASNLLGKLTKNKSKKEQWKQESTQTQQCILLFKYYHTEMWFDCCSRFISSVNKDLVVIGFVS